MYEGDTPLAERRAQALTLDRALLAELLSAGDLRELLDAEAIAEVEVELQRRRRARRPTSCTTCCAAPGDVDADGPVPRRRSWCASGGRCEVRIRGRSG